MREILFRGFHPCEDGDKTVYVEGKAVKGRWVYGAYCCMGDKQQPIPHIISYSKDDEFGDWVEVLPSTVSQYTGLTDKNGVKIFEGDILDEQGYLFTVVYDCKKAKFKLQHGDKVIQHPEWNRGILMEIIGNIHEEGRNERLD